MKIKAITHCRGSYTVEASIIVTLILLLLVVMIFSFTFFLQKVMLEQIAVSAAEQGAEIWNDSRKFIEDGAFNNDEAMDPLYYRVFDDSIFGEKTFEESLCIRSELKNKIAEAENTIKNGDLQDKKIARIRKLVYEQLGRTVLSPDNTNIKIQYINAAVSRSITVRLVQTIHLPMSKLAGLFGGKTAFFIQAEAVSAVSEPAELIRNIDLLREYIQKFSSASNSSRVIERQSGNLGQ